MCEGCPNLRFYNSYDLAQLKQQFRANNWLEAVEKGGFEAFPDCKWPDIRRAEEERLQRAEEARLQRAEEARLRFIEEYQGRGHQITIHPAHPMHMAGH